MNKLCGRPSMTHARNSGFSTLQIFSSSYHDAVITSTRLSFLQTFGTDRWDTDQNDINNPRTNYIGGVTY